METIEVTLKARSYPVLVGGGLLADEGCFAPVLGQRSLVVTDSTVAGLHLDALLAALGDHPYATCIVPAGDASKSLAWVGQVCGAASEAGVGRDGTFIALGGGAVCDLTGFAAAVYQRGIPVIQVPTTLLAQVDASVGGKTAVNHPAAKNLIGTFHQPVRVIADTTLLGTLPKRELSAGLAEVIKMGLLGDADFLDWLEGSVTAILAGDIEATTGAVVRCVRLKAAVVARDELDHGERALLNLGHTFGHAIETATGHQTTHGQAVAIGCVLAAGLSATLGWLNAGQVGRTVRLFESAGLPVRPPPGLDAGTLIDIMRRDKKISGDHLHLVLLKRPGEAVLTADYPHDVLVRTLNEACVTQV